jgi:hypothetical protein
MKNNIQQESPCGLCWLVHVIEARNAPILESCFETHCDLNVDILFNVILILRKSMDILKYTKKNSLHQYITFCIAAIFFSFSF